MAELDLNLLRVLVALDDQRSVSRAARRLDRSQPALSAALGKLREYFGDPLFLRSGNSMRPTPRAESVVAAARNALHVIDSRIIDAAEFNAATSERPVSFALSDVGEVTFLPRLLPMLRRLMPKAEIRSVSVPAAELGQQLENGQIDVACGYFPDLGGESFLQQVLFQDSFTCLIRKDHPIATDRLTIQQFTNLEHAVVRVESRTQEVIERYLARRKLARRVVLTTPHFASVPPIIAQLDLLVTVPEPLARFFATNSSKLRMVGLPFEPPRIDIKQFWHRRYHDDARNRWLRSQIYEAFAVKRENARDGVRHRRKR
jgi:DNA-binding transcriptional LysR family regulator